MKKITKMIATTVAAIACMSGFAACEKPQTGNPNEGASNGSITIGYTDYEPMNYTNEKGELVGFDTELAEKVFKDLGYKVRFKLIEWGNKYSELNSGTIDCVWNGFTANCADADDGIQRADKVDFSYYYMTNAQCVLRAATATELTSTAGFEGMSVAYESGSAGDTYVNGVKDVNVNKKAVGSQMDAIREVKSGTAQYAVVDLLLAKSIAGQGDFANVVINEGIVIDAEYYAVGFKKGSDLTAKVNEKFVEYAASGYLAELAAKYGLSNQVITDYSDQK